jgi:hypothetical protein
VRSARPLGTIGGNGARAVDPGAPDPPRAGGLDVAVGGRYLVDGDTVSVWPVREPADGEPLGSFAFALG